MRAGLLFLTGAVALGIVAVIVQDVRNELRHKPIVIKETPSNAIDLPNLVKQDDISRAVRVSAWADIAQVVAGVGTIALLFYTFAATRRGADAATITAESSIQAARAHLFVEVVGWRLIVRNYGQTPAMSTELRVLMAGRRQFAGAEVEQSDENEAVVVGGYPAISAGGDVGLDLIPETEGITEPVPSAPGAEVLYAVEVRYADVFGSQRRTYCSVVLRPNIHGIQRTRVDLREYE